MENKISRIFMDAELRMLSTALEQSPRMIIITDTKGSIEYVNQKFTKLTGYTLEEVIGKNPRILKSGKNPPEMYKRLWETITSGCEWHGELLNKKKDGGLYWKCSSLSPIRSSEGVITRFIDISEDITKHKEAEDKIKEAIEAKTNFTSMVSHELRTPLTTIEESIAVILDGLTGVINDEQKEYLTIAKRNVDRLARLINNVLDFEKLESGKTEINIQENDINEVVKEAHETMAPIIAEKGLNLIVKADEKLPRLKFDRDSIIQVLENIINNAIKVTYKGSITIITDKGDDGIHVSVEDTGIGIRKEDMNKLFHEFEQLARGKDRKTGGTGLGLAISKKIIEKHNGKIWAESEPGKGSIFHFTLPMK